MSAPTYTTLTTPALLVQTTEDSICGLTPVKSATGTTSSKDPSATVLDLVRPGVEDAMLTSTDISACSLFLQGPGDLHTNMSQQAVAGIFRGATGFGGYASFAIPPIGDYISWMMLEIDLGSWFPDNVLHFLRRGLIGGYTYLNTPIWYYANNLASTLIEQVWIEANGIKIDGFGGEWIDVWSRLFLTPSKAYSLRRDCMGWLPQDELLTTRPGDVFPTEHGRLLIPIPMWFMRHKTEAMPLSATKDGTLVLHVRFRPFTHCVRNDLAIRSCVTDTPAGKTFKFTDTRFSFNNTVSIVADSNAPTFKSCRALINYAMVDGDERNEMLHSPVVRTFQPIQTFPFSAPLRFAVATTTDNIIVNLPLELNGPVEELIWILRRTAVNLNNDWTNYGAYVETELAQGVTQRPLLRNATVQVNSVPWVKGDERFFRSSHAGTHSGITDAASAYIYHYSFSDNPEAVVPSQSVNTSKVDIRLVLDVRVPDTTLVDKGWEVIVFGLTRNWLRYQNGLLEPMFS